MGIIGIDLAGSHSLLAQSYITSSEPRPLMVLIAVAALVAAGAVLLRMWLVTRPNRPEEGPATSELGPEPPALVDLLTGGFTVEGDAVAATAVDLAARR